MKQGKIYHMKDPALVAARNLVMRFTNFPRNNLKKIHEYDAHDAINMHLLAKEYTVDGGYN
jgi:hypothetical protein